MLAPVIINSATKSDATPRSISNELFLLVFIINIKRKKTCNLEYEHVILNNLIGKKYKKWFLQNDKEWSNNSGPFSLKVKNAI